jgi:hypothetical protein
MIASMSEVCTDLDTNEEVIEVLEMRVRSDIVD